ncbi:MAG: hypothetical protein H6585_06130 [Flavobacteriales bacterium]|nr:hypothetical protein [Flavobacteriales bacterium]MCB9447906.1 hypothetical protein [Flavobacteriales bacterium]
MENWIKNNKDQLDFDRPSPDLWSRIEKDLDAKSPGRSNRGWMRVAAAVLLLAGAWIGYRVSVGSGADNGAVADAVVDSAAVPQVEMDVPQEVGEAEVYYAARIDRTMEEIEALDEDAKNDLVNEMKELEADFQTLEADMGSPVNREQVLEAMVRNYKMKLALLEDVLKELKNRKNDDGHEHVKSL